MSVQLNFNQSASQPTTTTNTNTPSNSASTYLQQAQNAFNAGQWQETCRIAQQCIAVAQNDVMHTIRAKNLYAAALMRLGQLEQALMLWQEISRVIPNDPGMLANIGLVLLKLRRERDAIGYFQRSVQITPSYNSYVNLGFACNLCGEITLAKESYQKAIALDSKSIQTRINLAEIFRAEARFEEAKQLFEEGLFIDPKNILLLTGMINLQQFSYPLDIESQKQYLRRYEQRLLEDFFPNVNSQTKPTFHQPLRVGFISADLWKHPVGFFLESVLEQVGVDPKLAEHLVLIAYHNTSKQDEYTTRLKAHFDAWYQVDTWSDVQLIEQIKQDHVDILIDLSGHTTGNRLPVFARKPAPLQLSWLGYFASTGLSSIDYVLADPICIPASEEFAFVEKIWRLPHLRYCFSIPEDAPEVSTPPCLQHQQIVIGCYQMLPKINQRVLQCWAQVLSASPNARLRIQVKEFAQVEAKKIFQSRLINAGINLERVDLVGAMDRKDYLASYSEVDFILDTFPYTGGTTTVEALWMGVPTLTLALPSMLGRQGEALLKNAGLADWVTHSEEEYVRKAIDWANAGHKQRQELARLRSIMREQVRLTPLFNATQFAQDFVHALDAMWNERCAN
ncbi:MAG: peptide-binding protein [Gammaproteobacteria bacterium]|nr:peptide-binding protein [Gammaproteobacteria bacterium]